MRKGISEQMKLTGKYYHEIYRGIKINGAPTDNGFYFCSKLFDSFAAGYFEKALETFRQMIDEKLKTTDAQNEE
jgi:pentatricopeptide repeat protein